MSDTLRAQIHFGNYGSNLSQTIFGTPSYEKSSSSMETRTQFTPLDNRIETIYSRPLLPSYTSGVSSINLASPVRYYGETVKPAISSGASGKTGNSTTSLPKGSFLPEKATRHQGMKTLVLDMDETLLHASTKPIAMPDCIVKLADGAKFYILKRPYLDEFLERLSKVYELVIYTFGEKEYATATINEVDPNRYISYILHRDHCSRSRGGVGKDLSLIGRNLKDVIFIDNLEENLRRQRENGIKISDFYSDKNDEELKALIPFLENVTQLEDVRPIRKFHAEYLSKGLQQINPPKSRQRSESDCIQTPRISANRKESFFGEDSNRVNSAFEERLNQTTMAINTPLKSYLSTPLKNTDSELLSANDLGFSPLKETQKSSIQARLEEKMHQLKTSRPAFNSGDQDKVNSIIDYVPNHKSSNTARTSHFQTSSNPWETLAYKQSQGSSSIRSPSVEAFSTRETKEIPFASLIRERIVLNKETITFSRERESGSIFDHSYKAAQKSTKIPERSPLLEDLYDRINVLEQRLKAKNYRTNF